MTRVRRTHAGAEVALPRRVLANTGLAALLLCALVVGFLGATLHPRVLLLWPALGVLLVAGAAWPWLTMLLVRGELRFAEERIHEGREVHVTLSLRSRALWPAWGLVLEVDAENRRVLDAVQPFSSASAALALRPQRRGLFPKRHAVLQTGFPLGLVNARRSVTVGRPLVVWPRVLPAAPPPGAGPSTRSTASTTC